MNEAALDIEAAGIKSPFGGEIKQLKPAGSNGEIIMDYSIYDVIESGFDKVVLLFEKIWKKNFKEAYRAAFKVKN